ncbi:MAG: hypothetical protein HZB67_05630 [Candidatus Aenigmarchaeota archaeon]|nr:hypothetical protein [Candidatus Aenigmarchaeota archaeon]
MGEELTRIYADASKLKSIIMENNNIDILLYLAKYNPKVTKEAIKQNFGDESIKSLNLLKDVNLIQEDDDSITLTDEGIFQVEGLLTLVI